MQINAPSDPLVFISYFLTVVIGGPGALLLVKAIAFITNANRDLKTVVEYVRERRSYDQHHELVVAFIQNDVNVLQDHVKITRREWPERRSGIERRAE